MTSLRDQVMDALLALLRSRCTTTFKHYSRRLLTWEDMIQNQQNAKPIQQPALFLYDGVGLGGGFDTIEQRNRGGPWVNTMKRTIVIYNRFPGGTTPAGQDGTTPGGTIFYPLVEALENTGMDSDSPSQNTLTLGGLVSHCWIEGEIHYVTPDIDAANGQGMCTVPLSIMLLPRSH